MNRVFAVSFMLLLGLMAGQAMAGTEVGSFTAPLNTTLGGSGVSNPTAHGVLVAEGSSAFTPLGVGSNGQVLVGSSGADPVFASIGVGTGISTTTGAGTLTINNTGVTSIVAGTNISISGGTGAVTINATGGAFPLLVKTTNYSVLAGDAGTLFTDAGASGTVIFTLPAATGTGNWFRFNSDAAQILEVLAGTGDKIRMGGQQSASAGNIQTTTGGRGNCVLICDVSTNNWFVQNATGSTWTVN